MNKRNYYNQQDGGLVFLFVMLFPQLLLFFMFYILGSIDVQLKNILLMIANQLVIFLIYLFYNKKNNINNFSASGIKFKLNWKYALIVVVLPIICILGFNYFVSLFDELLRLIGYSYEASFPMPIDTVGWFFVNVLILAVLPALVEELVFRGIIFNGFKNMGREKVIFFTAFLFAIFHSSPSQTLYQFILGVLLGYIVYFTGNLIYAIILHFLNNFFVLLMNFLLTINPALNLDIKLNALNIILIILGAALTAGVIFGILYWCFRISKKTNGATNSVPTQTIKFSLSYKENRYLYLGIAVSIVLWISTFVIYTF